MIAFDVTGAARDVVAALVGDLAAQADEVHAAAGGSAATVTIAVGASLFDGRFGLAGLRPVGLGEMPAFPNDVLDTHWCHGDLLVQVCAQDKQRVDAVAADLRRAVGDRLRERWRVAGFRPENGVSPGGLPTTRNLFGFREGAGNPSPGDAALMDQLIWVDAGEPAWAAGGTYQVVRLIRMATGLWDRDPLPHQEAVFGRRRADGVPLGHTSEDERFDYASDPDGQAIHLDAHIRRANPRTSESQHDRILRRGYSYRRTAGTDEGLIFICFQRDPERGFATIQRRLTGEALQRYVLPFGGGYFFVPGSLALLHAALAT